MKKNIEIAENQVKYEEKYSRIIVTYQDDATREFTPPYWAIFEKKVRKIAKKIEFIKKIIIDGRILKTSEQWYREIPIEFSVVILNADGWDVDNFDYSFSKELISKREFDKRLSSSTISSKTSFLESE